MAMSIGAPQYETRQPPEVSSSPSPPTPPPPSAPQPGDAVISADVCGCIGINSPTVHAPIALRKTAEITPCTVTSILSDAERSAQSELRSTSEILKLAGCVLRERPSSSLSGRISPTKTPSLISPRASPGIEIIRDRMVTTSTAGISLPPLSIETNLLSSPQGSPPQSPTEDNIHLPGKFGSLSSAEVKKKLTNSPVMRTELLKKLDGLDRVVPSSSSIRSNQSKDNSEVPVKKEVPPDTSILSCRSIEESNEEVGSKVAQSKPVVSAAMRNAHEHANKIKETAKRMKESSSHLVKMHPLGTHVGDNEDHLSGLAIDQSTRARARSPPMRQMGTMPCWVRRKAAAEMGENTQSEDSGECFGQYQVHPSETMISHEINRGDWTWATEWSPDGKYLALATENHGLAIVEADESELVWKVVHDERIGKVKNDTTHTIRSIAWGGTFIALGGTGDAVSIVEPCLTSSDDNTASRDCKQYSFDVVDVITETGFVGALSWLKNSNILAIGNREDQCLIAEIRRGFDGKVTSNVLHNIERSDWVTAVSFSHGGTKLAIGDRSGLLSVYLFVIIRAGEAPALSPLQDIPLEDSILTIEWSPDGKYLYTGGEDYSITILDTAKYSVLHRIGRDRWVNFLTPSHGGMYLAAGGGFSQVSLLEVNKKWEEVTSLPTDGVALSAKWHPKDEFLAICGQFNDVVVYEPCLVRKGKCVRTDSSIHAVEVSPDGKMIAVGNETGLVTIFDALTPTLATLYETVIGIGGDMTIKWSPKRRYLAIASGSTFVLLDSSYSGKEGTHPPSSAKFLVRKVIQSGFSFTSSTFSPNGQYLALTNDQTKILDVKNGCRCVRVLDQGDSFDDSRAGSTAWSADGSVFATVGGMSNLSIYDVKPASPDNWELLFSISFKVAISSLAWGPSLKRGLYYLAFGGESETVAIVEIRTQEKIWDTVLQIPCNSGINDLDWNEEGMLCIGDEDGSVSVMDLSYLKSGKAVSEMNYNWQRQGVISTTKLTSISGRKAITSLCWLPTSTIENNFSLAIGGSDGIFEVVDLSASD